MKILKAIFVLLMVFGSFRSWGWVQPGNTTIKEFVQWESSNAGYALLILETDQKCYVTLAEKELYSLVLALYMSGKTFNLHCHDSTENINGYTAHKIHRINAIK